MKALQLENPIDAHLKPVKTDETNTSLEISTEKIRVKDIEVTGTIKGITMTGDIIHAGTLTLDVGSLVLDSNDGITKFYLAGDMDDLCTLTVAANGVTTIATNDSDGFAGHLILDADGEITLEPAAGNVNITSDITMPSVKKLYLDGGGDTYIIEASADAVRWYVGGDILLAMTENGDDGNFVNFANSCAGFTRIEAHFSVTDVIASGGTDDTDIDFRHSNKYRLEMTGDITTINLIFPSVSGNFLLVCATSGDHDVTNWKVWEADESAGTTTDVMWAGGSVPAFTDTGIDIVSFYWDANEQQAYGTASLAFAEP